MIKKTSWLRFFVNKSAPSHKSDVDDEGPTTSKKVKGHIAGIVEPHHSKMGRNIHGRSMLWFLRC